jgi:hypothetical protein
MYFFSPALKLYHIGVTSSLLITLSMPPVRRAEDEIEDAPRPRKAVSSRKDTLNGEQAFYESVMSY